MTRDKNAERQARYRANAKLRGEAGEQVLNMYISSVASEALTSLIKTCGMTKKELIEFLLLEELERAKLKVDL